MPANTYIATSLAIKVRDSVQRAIKQIEDHSYAIPYQTNERRVIKIGVMFNIKTRPLRNGSFPDEI